MLLFHQGMEIGPLHTDLLGGMGDVSVAFFEGLDEKGLFYFSKIIFQKLSLDSLELLQGFWNRIPPRIQ